MLDHYISDTVGSVRDVDRLKSQDTPQGSRDRDLTIIPVVCDESGQIKFPFP